MVCYMHPEPGMANLTGSCPNRVGLDLVVFGDCTTPKKNFVG